MTDTASLVLTPIALRRKQRMATAAVTCFAMAALAFVGLIISAAAMGQSGLTTQQKGDIIVLVCGGSFTLILSGIALFSTMIGNRWLKTTATGICITVILIVLASPLVFDPLTRLIYQ